MNSTDTKLMLRESVWEDAELLFRWANEESVRKNSLNMNNIIWEDHINWFRANLNDKNKCLMILEEKGVPVGQIRLAFEHGYWNINYSIEKENRGKGYGKKIILLVIEKFPAYKFRAIVKESNISSKNIFEKIGFVKIESGAPGLVLYIYHAK